MANHDLGGEVIYAKIPLRVFDGCFAMMMGVSFWTVGFIMPAIKIIIVKQCGTD